MSEDKKPEPSHQDEVTLLLKLPRHLRDSFTRQCREADSNAQRELRGFIRRYLAGDEGQGDMFGKRAKKAKK